MDPYTGKIYGPGEAVSDEVSERVVEIKGEPRSIRRASEAARTFNDITSNDWKRRRAANKRARQSRKRNRK